MLRGQGFAQPNPRPMFPNPPGLLRLEPYSEGLRERIWWGAASNATAVWAAKLGMNLQSSTLKNRRDRRALPRPAGRADPDLSRGLEGGRPYARAARVGEPQHLRAGRRSRPRLFRARRRGRGPDRLHRAQQRAVFGRSYAAEPDVLIEELKTGRGDRRGRHAAADRAEPARRRVQCACDRGDPDACRAGLGWR